MSARVLVTGAASGIGEASVAELRRRGAEVVGLDLKSTSGDILECDVRDQESVERAVAAAIERLGGLDGLIRAPAPSAPPADRPRVPRASAPARSQRTLRLLGPRPRRTPLLAPTFMMGS